MKKTVIRDLKSVLYYSSRILFAFAFVLVIPLITAAIFSEWNMFFSFLFSFSLTFLIASLAYIFFRTDKELSWLSGMLVVVVTWAIVNFISAIPCYQSGFYSTFIDGFFDSMSGYTTTGLSVIQDLDHAPNSLHMWRHLMQYVGGQGIVVLALIFLARSLRGAVKSYVGEAREERLWPNIKSTAVHIWRIANIYLALGTVMLSLILVLKGVQPVKAFLHGLWITMSGWATGGFAPSTLSILAYHSEVFEYAVALVMFLGSMNFAVHFAVWKGRAEELFKNIELRTFIVYYLISFLVVLGGLMKFSPYSMTSSEARFSFFQVASAVTGTGYSNVLPQVLTKIWNDIAIFGVCLAMALGASACSTAGGIKAIRVALGVKGLSHEVKRIIHPESSIIYTYYHHIRKQAITDNQVKMAMLITIAYICTYLTGAVVGSFYGYPFLLSLYESVSATANVGLSAGITGPSMPLALKIVYIVQMWLGRLEFTALFALIGYSIVLFRR